jgi:hypothetical protein
MEFSDIDYAYNCTQSEGWAGDTNEIIETFLKHDQNGYFLWKKTQNRLECVFQEN